MGNGLRRRRSERIAGSEGHTVFFTVYPGDVLFSTALGIYRPTTWSAQDWAIDVVEKYIQAQATGFVFDRFLDPARTR